MAGNKRELCDVKPFVVIVQSYHNGVAHLSIECVEEATWKDQIAIPEDKHDSSCLPAQLWRNDELSENQQGSQPSLTKASILQTHMLK